MDGEVCLLSSMCRKLEAERRMKEGSASAALAVLCWSKGSWDVEQRSLLRLVTPRSGHVHPFCSL